MLLPYGRAVRWRWGVIKMLIKEIIWWGLFGIYEVERIRRRREEG